MMEYTESFKKRDEERAKVPPGPKKKNKPLFIRLLPFLKPHLGKYIVLFILVTISSVLGLLPPYLMRIAIDNAMLNPDMNGILLICYAVILFGAAEGFIGFGKRYLQEYLGQKVVMDIRVRLYSHTSQQSFSFFDKTRTGDIMARVISDTQRMQEYLTMGFLNLVTNLITLGGVLFILFSWNVFIGAIFLIDVPFILIGMRSFLRKVTPAHVRTRRANAIITSSIQECLNGIREVKLYGKEEFMLDVFDSWNQEYYDSIMESTKQGAFWMHYTPFLISLSSAFVLMIGGMLVVQDQLTPGLLIATVTYFSQLMGPLGHITRFLGMSNAATAAGNRVFEIFEKKPDITTADGGTPMQDVKGHVEFKNVSFWYHEGNYILNDINLDIPPGKIVAFVGPSGVGKTTLLHLLPRFYEVTNGTILVDGRDIKTFTLDSLRKNVGIVMQDTFLFDGTIADNISFGKPNATKSEIQEAARVARLDTFISTLPNGYKTFIGERGVRLSGGQAQRLSLARVMLTDPKILIMDEPTANVDAITDKDIMNAVHDAMKGRTTFVIAHRLWTIKNADQIVLLKNGGIEATGTHQELLHTSPFYKEFFSSQIQEPGARDAGVQEP